MRKSVAGSRCAISQIRKEPKAFFRLSPAEPGTLACFAVRRGEVRRCDAHFHLPKFRHLIEIIGKRRHIALGKVISFSSEIWLPEKSKEETFRYIEISGIDLITGEATATETPVNEAPSRARMLVRDGDMLISLTRPHHGAIAMVDSTLDECVASTGFAVVRDIEKSVIPQYLWHILRTNCCLEQMLQRSSGGNYPAITQDELEQIIIPFPLREVQERLLIDLEAARAARKQKLAEADALLAGVDNFVLEQLGLSVPQEEKRLAFAIRRKQIDEALNAERYANLRTEKLVKGEPIGNMMDIVENKISPSNAAPDELFDWIRIDDLPNHPLEVGAIRTELGKDIDGSLFEVQENDILIARLGPTILNAKFVLCPKTNRKTVASGEFLVLRCREGWNRVAVLWVLRTKMFRDLMYSKARGGTPSRYRLNREDMAALTFPNMSKDAQKVIVAEIESRLADVKRLRAQANTEWAAAKVRFERQLLGDPADQLVEVTGEEWVEDVADISFGSLDSVDELDFAEPLVPGPLLETPVPVNRGKKKQGRTLDSMRFHLGEYAAPSIIGSAPALPTLPAAANGPSMLPTATGTKVLPASATEDLQADLLKNPRNVPVWFGTNRAPVNRQDVRQGFSDEWNNDTTLGRCIVNVPKGHVPGDTGSAWWIRLVKGDDRLNVVSIEPLPHFWSQIGKAMKEPREEGSTSEALFFLHGYNVTFEQAAIRTAQLAYDLRIHPAAFFSWPSGGVIDDYSADEATIEASYDAISDFVKRLDVCALEAGATLHVVAHSMGNRALLKALEAVAQGMTGGRKSAIDKLVFAAPDVDARVFMQSLNKFTLVGERKTLYTSHRDKAVWLSKAKHKYDRAGLIPPVVIAPGLDTVDATGVDDTFLGHNYFATVRALINDLSGLIKGGLPPKQRVGLEPAVTQNGQKYWQIL